MKEAEVSNVEVMNSDEAEKCRPWKDEDIYNYQSAVTLPISSVFDWWRASCQPIESLPVASIKPNVGHERPHCALYKPDFCNINEKASTTN